MVRKAKLHFAGAGSVHHALRSRGPGRPLRPRQHPRPVRRRPDWRPAGPSSTWSAGGLPTGLFACFLRPVHGFESPAHIADYLGSIGSAADVGEAAARFEAAKLAALEPYPGVAGVLGELRDAGLPLGVVSDADTAHASARLERCGLARYFEVVVTPDVTGERKPAPTNFLHALGRLGAGPSDAAMVGDSLRRDIEPAKALGLLSVHAAYGDWNPGFVCTPDHRLDSIAALVPILLG